ncbi:MAG: hypothetical protein QMD88_04215 [Coprothermobacterota bacterium]|nr:hypothetical protein [Coprothermobacterota bacterium]
MVIAIIAILAAIAIPNYIAIQDRAYLATARESLSYLRSFLEIYRVDNKSYPLSLIMEGENRGSPLAPSIMPLLDWDKALANLEGNSLTYSGNAESSNYTLTGKANDRNHTVLTATPTGIFP